MSFDPEVAKEVGTDAAIIYENIKYWIDKNRANKKSFHDGTWWTYNSQKAFVVQFTWLTRQQLRTCLTKLEEVSLVKTGNYNKVKYDRTKWYALGNHSISGKQQIDWLESTNELVKVNQTIPNVNTNDNSVGEHPTLDSIMEILEEWILKFASQDDNEFNDGYVRRLARRMVSYNLARKKYSLDWKYELMNWLDGDNMKEKYK